MKICFITIVLQNYHDGYLVPRGRNMPPYKMFHDKHFFFLPSCPQVTFTISIIRYGFGSSLPSCTAKSFRVYPNDDFSIYRYREAGSTLNWTPLYIPCITWETRVVM